MLPNWLFGSMVGNKIIVSFGSSEDCDSFTLSKWSLSSFGLFKKYKELNSYLIRQSWQCNSEN